MNMSAMNRKYAVFAGAFALAVAAGLVGVLFFNGPATIDHTVASGSSDTSLGLVRDANVPELPFADNPDPTVCGIPVQWGSDTPAFLTGIYQGEMLQSEVLLYDSHQRFSLTGSAPHGTQVEILLYQENPVLDFYLVKTIGPDPQEGWIPAPFLSFDPIDVSAAG